MTIVKCQILCMAGYITLNLAAIKKVNKIKNGKQQNVTSIYFHHRRHMQHSSLSAFENTLLKDSTKVAEPVTVLP